MSNDRVAKTVLHSSVTCSSEKLLQTKEQKLHPVNAQRRKHVRSCFHTISFSSGRVSTRFVLLSKCVAKNAQQLSHNEASHDIAEEHLLTLNGSEDAAAVSILYMPLKSVVRGDTRGDGGGEVPLSMLFCLGKYVFERIVLHGHVQTLSISQTIFSSSRSSFSMLTSYGTCIIKVLELTLFADMQN